MRERRLADLSIYTLLYLPQADETHMNMGRVAENSLAIYLKCAALLNRSLCRLGASVTILTNDPARLCDLQRRHGTDVKTRTMSFTLAVPDAVRFRSAHFKLEAMTHFGSGDFGDLVLLLDADMLALREVRLQIPQSPFLIGYPLRAESRDPQLLRSKAILLDGRADVTERWWGGEFLIGDPAGFRAISPAIDEVYARYRDRFRRCHHQGDEMVMNAALDLSQAITSAAPSPLTLSAAGGAEIVSRWWSVRTRDPGEPLTSALTKPLIHLPADKGSLAEIFTLGQGSGELTDILHARLARKTRVMRSLRALLPLISPGRVEAPRL